MTTPALRSIGPDKGESFRVGVLAEVFTARATCRVSIEAESDVSCVAGPAVGATLAPKSCLH